MGVKNGKTLSCTECRKEFYRSQSRLREVRCSKACANAYVSRVYKSDTARKAQLFEAQKLRGVWHHTEKAKSRLREIMLARYKDPEYKKTRLAWLAKNLRRGKDCHLWRGGVSKPNSLARASGAYKDWRDSVYRRDGYSCQKCGKVGGRLHAHHIEPFAVSKEKRFDLSNGMTLCVLCHRAIHRRYIP